MQRKTVFRNIICSLSLQFVTIISGFIVPKIILNNFGSDVNGLISSISQFLNYVQLLEGGLSSVIMAALYKPLAEGDNAKISGVINAAQVFFRKIATIYVVYMLIIVFLYPLFFKTGYSYTYSAALIVVLGMNLFVQYFFSLTYKLLLNADGKVYIVSLTQIVIVLVNMLAIIFCAKYFKDILIIRLASAVVFLIQPVVYGCCVKKYYKIDKKEKPDNNALKQRWDGFGINLAYFVHTNTDVIILTIFSTLANVSIYGIYLMIVNAIKNFVLAVSQAIVPFLGKTLVKGNSEESNHTFDVYEFGIYMITVFAFSCGAYLITPFVRVYTLNITDANYEQYLFGYILIFAEMVYCLRDPYVSVTYSAGHFKQVTKYAIAEVFINLIVSLLLVKKLGIVGVAIGTLFSMIYRMIAHILYLKKNILYRKTSIAVKKIIVFAIAILISNLLSHMLFNDMVLSYWSWFCLAIKEALLCMIIILGISYLFFRNELEEIVGKKFHLR